MTLIQKKQWKPSNGTIERLGLETVPKAIKTTTAFDYIRIQTAVSINAGNFLVPALAVLEGGLSFIEAVVATVIGALIAFFFVSVLSLPGAKYGIPAQYAIRTLIGTKGAMWLSSPVRTITSLYWFSVQTIAGTYMVKEIMERSFGIEPPFLVISFLLAIIMAYLALVGFQAIKKFTAYFIPVLFLAGICMVYVFMASGNSGNYTYEVDWSFSIASIGTIVFFASLTFVQYVSGVSTSSDLSRYGKSAKHAFTGIYAGNGVGFFFTAVLGAYTASAAGHWNPFLITSQWADQVIIVVIISVAALISMITINLNNAYSGGYSLLNSFPKLGRVKSALIFGLAGVLLSLYPGVVDDAERFISMLGIFLVPLSAVIVADFIVYKKLEISSKQLILLSENKNPFNKEALWSVIFGMFVYVLLPNSLSPGFISFLVTCSVYLMLKRKEKE